MADASVLAERLSRLVRARGWSTQAHRFTLEAVEPAFMPTRYVWIAGSSRTISETEVYRTRPSRIIVEDFAPRDQYDRLVGVMDDLGLPNSVSTYSRFVDEVWDAARALHRADRDAASSDVELEMDAPVTDPNGRHVPQSLSFGSIKIPDHRALEFGLPDSASCLAVEADAGLGKSELLKWHEWRYSTMYKSALNGNPLVELPPIALRVSLRDFKSLSLDYIAHALSQPFSRDSDVALPAITSGTFLRELLIQRRLILLLDGLDEVSGDSEMVDAGVLEWRRAVADGARLVATSRKGHSTCRAAISKRFAEDERATLEPISDSAGVELLEKRGTESARARALVQTLSGTARNIPLFLLLAKAVDLDSSPMDAAPGSRSLMLWRLLELFCERDSQRLGLSGDEQMAMLTQIAEWLHLGGDMSSSGLLESLGVDKRDPMARVVDNPHALLMYSGESLGFKYREFEALFTARAIVQAWSEFGFESVRASLRSKRLDSDVVEFAARFIRLPMLAGAWSVAGSDAEYGPLLKRNLLAIALAAVEDQARAGSPVERGNTLSRLLGDRVFDSVSFSGLYLSRYDFSGWTFHRIHGHGGVVSYCEHLWLAEFDESIQGLKVEGQGFERPRVRQVDVNDGIQRLSRLIKPMRRRNGRGITSIMSVDESRDSKAWEILVGQGLAAKSGKANMSRWTLNDVGMEALTSFWAAELRGPEALADVVTEHVQLHALIAKLAEV